MAKGEMTDEARLGSNIASFSARVRKAWFRPEKSAVRRLWFKGKFHVPLFRLVGDRVALTQTSGPSLRHARATLTGKVEASVAHKIAAQRRDQTKRRAEALQAVTTRMSPPAPLGCHERMLKRRRSEFVPDNRETNGRSPLMSNDIRRTCH
jgi:hypothetical protein